MIIIVPTTALSDERAWFRALLHLLRIRWQWWWHSDRAMAGVKGYHIPIEIFAIEGAVDKWLLEDGRIVGSEEIEVIADVTDMTGHKASAFETYRQANMQSALDRYRKSPAGQPPVCPGPSALG